MKSFDKLILSSPDQIPDLAKRIWVSGIKRTAGLGKADLFESKIEALAKIGVVIEYDTNICQGECWFN